MIIRLIRKSIPFFIFLFMVSGLSRCVVGGPDVISAKEAEARLTRACAAKVFFEHNCGANEDDDPDNDRTECEMPAEDPVKITPTMKWPDIDPVVLCNYEGDMYVNKDEKYLLEAVDECERIITSIHTDNYTDFAILYVLARTVMCDLHPVEFFTFERPFQGGV